MHPRLCALVSEMSYEGRLASHAAAAMRELRMPRDAPSLAQQQHPPLAPRRQTAPQEQATRAAADGSDEVRNLLTRRAGVQFVEVVHHQENTQSSPEEAETVAQLCDELLRTRLHSPDGERALRWEDVLLVAPYNAQVRLLTKRLPAAARVGTVDKFQGQEAPVVILCLCHSEFSDELLTDPRDGEGGAPSVHHDGGRGLSFVLNRNRLNVALSRAQCLAIVVASTKLAEASAKSIVQQRELNFLCRIRELGVANDLPEENGCVTTESFPNGPSCLASSRAPGGGG
uniref:DNA2/NAM7 helicase-like C-terminal domain-containing protein n=1 Tax=Calcidiscus leptoporus TaxID=127549 RepID=A0A7S0IZY7_9EUKA|mmetsp:Transcript_31986/g.74552  ORF Transcript_31986/g.74552 Transcript_31986/m.74552 type:complete len:286 (+) Transcript_31986:2-859(+)